MPRTHGIDIKKEFGLFDHQVTGVNFLVDKKRAILADSMGTGKTKQATVAAGISSNAGILVICPASLKINWEREIHMVYPEDEVSIVGTGPEIDLNPVWIVINYDMLQKYLGQILSLIKEGRIDTAIIDEAHYIKGRKTLRSDAVLAITKDIENVYCLTGTPVMNRPVELFNLLKAIKHPLSKTRTEFTKRYCGAQLKTLVRDQMMHRTFFVNPENSYAFRAQKNRYRVMTFLDDKGATHLDELHENTKESILRRTKKEVLDLPEKIISFQLCELDSAKQKEYEEAWEVYLHWIETHPEEEKDIDNIMMAQHLVEIGKLKQVCSLSKTKRIADDIENAVEQDEKVIVFSQYTQTVYELERELTAKKIKWVQLTGENSQDERQWAVDEFQTKPETKVFIANIKAGGVGLNLTAASIVMFADMEWSPEIHAQAEDRAHRIGQEGTVNIYYYVTKDTIEEDIAEVLDQKRGVIEEVMDGKRSQKSMASDILKRIKEKRQ